MRKKHSNASQQTGQSVHTGKGLISALCTAAAAGTAGVLAFRSISRKPKKELPPSPETEAEKIRENLMRTISHDLRTPLSGIMGNSLLYLESDETLDDVERRRLVTYIHKDSGWLLNIVENLLAITRIRNAENAIGIREEIVEEVLGEALQKMETRHPEFKIRASIPDEIIMLPMDALLIEQVIINLLENALLHSGSKEPVDIIVKDKKDCAAFIVRDYGQGISEEVLGHLFDSSPLSDAVSDSHKKTGIGLLICKAIICAHHGTLIGQNHSLGAEFIFTLPKGANNLS
ncbi:MAG: sensor histidine kinase [Lachnospiraceae bacterium]|nr:sensor histidine kinase [Lachnospiraceae bacterium]